MRKLLALLLSVFIILALSGCETGQNADSQETAAVDGAITINLNPDCEAMTKEKSEELVYQLYDNYCAEELNDPERISEVAYTTEYDYNGNPFDCGTISYDGYEMRYGVQIIGEPDENGKYPLYIALHGGGSATTQENDELWQDMYWYYNESVESGIYVNCRGVTDTWDLHFQDASYYCYDRLIEDMILFEDADPNRIYVVGFSAGGDGSYQIAAHMADRFAAADMSSGNPNDVSPISLANLPVVLQAGIRDNAYDRNTILVDYGSQMDDCASKYGFGYEHEIYIHVPEGHNYEDNNSDTNAKQEVVADLTQYQDLMSEDNELSKAVSDEDIAYSMDDTVNAEVEQAVQNTGLRIKEVDSNAIRWVSQYTRDPYPEKVVWDLDTRASERTVDSFYYLKAPAETTGILVASYDKEDNAITIDASSVNGDFSILFNPLMLDLSKPVKVYLNSRIFLINVNPSEETITESLQETSDIYRAYAAEITYGELCSYAYAE